MKSCKNSINFSQILIIVTQIERKKRYLPVYLKKKEKISVSGRMNRSLPRLDRLHNTDKKYRRAAGYLLEGKVGGVRVLVGCPGHIRHYPGPVQYTEHITYQNYHITDCQ